MTIVIPVWLLWVIGVVVIPALIYITVVVVSFVREYVWWW